MSNPYALALIAAVFSILMFAGVVYDAVQSTIQYRQRQRQYKIKDRAM